MNKSPSYENIPTLQLRAGSEAEKAEALRRLSYVYMAPKYDWECPVCHEPAELPCRSLSTHRVSDTHMARIEILETGLAISWNGKEQPNGHSRSDVDDE